MSQLMIKDLDMSKELDSQTMAGVMGGSSFNFDNGGDVSFGDGNILGDGNIVGNEAGGDFNVNSNNRYGYHRRRRHPRRKW
jgi:hypothetical protein